MREEDLGSSSWPMSRLAEALEALARSSGLGDLGGSAPGLAPIPKDAAGGEEAVARWMQSAAAILGLEAEPVSPTYAEVDRLLMSGGPALLRIAHEGEPRFLCVLGGRRRTVTIVAPDLKLRRLPSPELKAAICRRLREPVAREIDRILEQARVPDRRRQAAREAILRERLGSTQVSDCWLLRHAPGTSFWLQVRSQRLPGHLATLAGAHLVQYLLWICSWWVVGQAALQGRLDRGWLLAWTLLLLTIIPFQVLITWLQGRLAIGAGALLKKRLLFGALRLDPEEIRHQGVGQIVGRVIESDAVESLALTGGFLGLVAGIETLVAAVVLWLGAGGAFHALLLLAWVGGSVFLARRYLTRRGRWTDARLSLTHDLIERMVGHRTRLAQEQPADWHDGEDHAVDRYLRESVSMDKASIVLTAIVPRGWLVLGLVGIAPSFVQGRATPGALAVGLGGTLLAYRALKRLSAGLAHMAGAAIAWRQVAPLFHSAARARVSDSPSFSPIEVPSAGASAAGTPLIEARDLSFRYQERGRQVLQGCSLVIRSGDRLLLGGASGEGKSTLASLLAGLRAPDSGLLLLNGLDRQTLGEEGWRSRLAAAPQFHENHVFTGTFAFNLLMGGRWPPTNEELEKAEVLCRELGLGPLLQKMPAGLLQMVGESGWQLSHGERSRLYIARALLQGADLVLLDESFAALDPESMRLAMGCVLQRAPTLLVIAHP